MGWECHFGGGTRACWGEGFEDGVQVDGEDVIDGDIGND